MTPCEARWEICMKCLGKRAILPDPVSKRDIDSKTQFGILLLAIYIDSVYMRNHWYNPFGMEPTKFDKSNTKICEDCDYALEHAVIGQHVNQT